MSARDETLRLVRGHLQAAAALIDSLLPAEISDLEEPGLTCPHCGERREAKLEDTSTERQRITCLSCGNSFEPAEVMNG